MAKKENKKKTGKDKKDKKASHAQKECAKKRERKEEEKGKRERYPALSPGFWEHVENSFDTFRRIDMG